MFLATNGGAFADGHESTIAHLTGEKLRMHRFPFPPYEEQKGIVKHIDHELAGIHSAIEHVKTQISLLREYRTRLISDVVTGKLDVRAVAAALPDDPEDDVFPIDDTPDDDASPEEDIDPSAEEDPEA
jgi:type I restriction enzyme S subunit